MKPLSERLKDFPNGQFVDWLCLACVDVREVRTPDDAQEEINKIRDAVTERLAALDQEVQKNLDGALAWQQRAEAAEAKLAELEKQASEQKPFMYGIMTANGDAHFEDFCVSSDAGLLEDVIWEWNNTLADNEPKNRVVPLFTSPTPAINLAELVPCEGFLEETSDESMLTWQRGWNACRAAILRNIEEEK